jgi:hypothetical protein
MSIKNNFPIWRGFYIAIEDEFPIVAIFNS